MDEKRRSKRKSMDDGYWDCSVCTYRNTPEAFKCEMCDVRKGTSTRKPRLNPQLVAQQVAQQFPAPPKKEKTLHRRDKDGKERDVRDRGDAEKDDLDSLEQDDSMDTDLQDQSSSWSADGDTIDASPQEPKTEPKSETKEEEKPEAVTPPPLPPQPSQPKKEIKEKKASNASTSHPGTSVKKHRTPRLKNIDRSSGTSMEVTVGDVTVIITDYKPKKDKHNTSSTAAQDKDTSRPQQGSQSTESGPSHTQPAPQSTNPSAWQNRTEKVETNGHIELDNKNR